jgi:hypothetical protein
MQPSSASGSCFPEVNIDSFSILLKIFHEFIQVALQLFKIHLSLSFTLWIDQYFVLNTKFTFVIIVNYVAKFLLFLFFHLSNGLIFPQNLLGFIEQFGLEYFIC